MYSEGVIVKKILIVNNSLKTGGIETALVSMANTLKSKCHVELLIFNPSGPLRDRLQEGITVLPVSWRTRALGMTIQEALNSKDIRLILFRVLAAIWAKLFDNALPIRWAFAHEKTLGPYDLAISFHEEESKHTIGSGFTRFLDQCVIARKKAAWLHYDAASIDLDNSFNFTFYQRMDKLVFVSRSLMDGFARLNPQFRDKADYCYNVLDREEILAMSHIPQSVPYSRGRMICFSACRLARVKALSRGIRALAPVFREHREWMWYIAGDGPEKSNIQQAICESGLEDRIILIGQQNNPYPYMRHADLLMNVSYHEAAPMVFMEAHMLGVPVFATRTSSADELLRDGETDFICENSEEGIREGFARLMDDPQRIRQAKRQATASEWPFESSVDKVLSWAEDACRQ